jgi:prephenate dehydrogenase
MTAVIGIISIGEMGLGFGQLLKAHNYRVVTNGSDRRQASSSSQRCNLLESV